MASYGVNSHKAIYLLYPKHSHVKVLWLRDISDISSELLHVFYLYLIWLIFNIVYGVTLTTGILSETHIFLRADLTQFYMYGYK